MATIILNLSKYILMFVMLLFTYLCFRKYTKLVSAFQKVFTLLIFGICYAIILYFNYSAQILIVCILELVHIIFFPILLGNVYENMSKMLINNMTFMLALGYVMVTRLSPNSALKQFLIVLAGSIIFFFIPLFVKKDKIIKLRIPFAIIGIILLGITLILGKTSFGANISFTIAGITFQPSEFVKILFVLFVAAELSKASKLKEIMVSAIISLVHILILVASADLGAALIFSIVYLIMIYIATGKLKYLLCGFVAGSAASVIAYKLFYHVRTRVTVWLNPWEDIDRKGYQITQSLFAIGTGGLFGMGFYQGRPETIPVVEKDFVFSAISEELGLVFALCVIFVCIGIFIEIMRIAASLKDMFYKLLAAGFGVLYIFQCFLTIGGVTKFIPSTGVTLPFVSYGGSSILSSLIVFAIIQTMHMRAKEDANEKQESKS